MLGSIEAMAAMLTVPEPLAEHVRPFRRAEYERMVEAGVFGEDRVELLFGAIVRMTPHGPPHDATLTRLAALLGRSLPDGAELRVQCSFAAGSGSEPEPDLAVVPQGDYDDAHPSEAFLIVEVAMSSLAIDRGAKARLYAECGVPEYWVVDVAGKVVEVHTDPSEGHYRTVTTRRRGEALEPIAVPGVRVEVDGFVR